LSSFRLQSLSLRILKERGVSMSRNAKEIREDNVEDKVQVKDENEKNRLILEEITIEELAVDGICGIY